MCQTEVFQWGLRHAQFFTREAEGIESGLRNEVMVRRWVVYRKWNIYHPQILEAQLWTEVNSKQSPEAANLCVELAGFTGLGTYLLSPSVYFKWCQAGIQASHYLTDPFLEAKCTGFRGIARELLGEVEEALADYTRVIDRLVTDGRLKAARYFASLACTSAAENGKRELCNTWLALLDGECDPHDRARSKLLQGNLAVRDSKFSEAEIYFAESIKAAKSVPCTLCELRAHEALGRFYYWQKKNQLALITWLEAAKALDRMDSAHTAATIAEELLLVIRGPDDARRAIDVLEPITQQLRDLQASALRIANEGTGFANFYWSNDVASFARFHEALGKLYGFAMSSVIIVDPRSEEGNS